MRYWVNAISRDHVRRGVDGGFIQANHGKDTALKRLKADDWILFYSPKTAYDGGERLQAFTAIGQISDDDLYQIEMTLGFLPWRRDVDFKKCSEAPIRPLIDQLGFIQDKTHWGYKFRFGLFEISQTDFELIRDTMRVTS